MAQKKTQKRDGVRRYLRSPTNRCVLPTLFPFPRVTLRASCRSGCTTRRWHLAIITHRKTKGVAMIKKRKILAHTYKQQKNWKKKTYFLAPTAFHPMDFCPLGSTLFRSPTIFGTIGRFHMHHTSSPPRFPAATYPLPFAFAPTPFLWHTVLSVHLCHRQGSTRAHVPYRYLSSAPCQYFCALCLQCHLKNTRRISVRYKIKSLSAHVGGCLLKWQNLGTRCESMTSGCKIIMT